MAELNGLSQNAGVDPTRPPLNPATLRAVCEASLLEFDQRKVQAVDLLVEALRDNLNSNIGVIDPRLLS